MTASNPEVLPCPFCGADPLEHAIEPHSHGGALKALGVPDHPGSHFIECGCGAGMIAEAKQAVRDMWNRRETYTYQQARIAELEAAIKDPETVFLNMKRGAIATPSVRLWSKLFGEVLNDDDARLIEIARLRERLAELETALRNIAAEVDGNIRECVRDCVNQRGNVQDIYNYCDRIDSTVGAALAQQGKEGE